MELSCPLQVWCSCLRERPSNWNEQAKGGIEAAMAEEVLEILHALHVASWSEEIPVQETCGFAC